MAFCSTGSRSVRLSYGGVCSGSVRALGLEPSLVRGKGPVPYLSGMTRMWVGEESNPLCREDGWITASCAPWRDRPVRGLREMAPTTMLCSCQDADGPICRS